MAGGSPAAGGGARVIVGVDGSGRTHRLEAIAAAAEGPVLRVSGGHAEPGLAERLTAEPRPLVLVDDAHRLDEQTAGILLAAARRGVPVVLARRPTLQRADLAALEEVVAGSGGVEVLQPLQATEVAGLVTAALGRPGSEDLTLRLLEASGGMPAVAVVLAGALATRSPGQAPGAGDRPGSPPPELAAAVQRRVTLLPPGVAELARVLALRLDLDDATLAASAGIAPDLLPDALRSLRDAGMLVPGEERMVPAVAEAVIAEQPAAARRAVHDRIARALLAAGTDPLVAAAQLRAARARTRLAADAFLAAADLLRWRDPAAALEWLDDAVDAGAEPAAQAATRAEVAAQLGLPVDVGPIDVGPDLGVGGSGSVAGTGPASGARLALVAGAVAAHDGRPDRSAAALLTAGPLGEVLAVPALVAVGHPDRAAAAVAAGAGVPAALRRLAEAALAAGTAEPAVALPLLIEAAEAAQRTPPAVVLPDTPHALAALVAVAAGDASTAEHLLAGALESGIGGPVAAERHRLLLAWVQLRTGHFDAAVRELRGPPAAGGRERLLRAAVAAGLARRRGDIAALRACWADVEPVLARRTIDVFAVEPVEELLVAATRLRQHPRVTPILDTLDEIVARLGHPAAWTAAVCWARLQVAVAGDDAAAAARAAGGLTGRAAGGLTGRAAPADAEPVRSQARAPTRQDAQSQAAGCWAAMLAGEVDAEAVLSAVDALAGVGQLPWEASRLAGQAAIRTADPRITRRLLERARELSGADALPAAGPVTTAPGPVGDPRPAGLSEREVEVARLVLAGRTYREIGSQLYIAPKTVEHHVARIRAKLGAQTRAEFVAALHGLLDAEPG